MAKKHKSNHHEKNAKDEASFAPEEAPEQESTSEQEESAEDKADSKASPKKKGKTKKNKKPKKAREGLGEELIEVYESTGDDLSSVTMLEHKHRTWKRMLVWILVFLVAVFVGVAAVSWYIWGGGQSFTGENVSLEITGPETLASGSDVEYIIQYGNNEDVSFRKSEIELRYPPGFMFEEASPQPSSENHLWDLGTVARGESGEITVSGKLVGKPELETTLSGTMRYWPANFSSEFQEVASAQTMMKPVEADLQLEASDQVLVGQSTSISLLLENETDAALENLRLEAFYPEGFVVEETSPETTEEGLWDIEALAAEEEKEFIVDGYFSSYSEEAELITALSQKGPEDEYFQQKERRQDIKLVQGDLLGQLIVNGNSSDASVQWGEPLNVSVSYQNQSETELGDISAVARLTSRYRVSEAESASDGAIDFSTLVDSASGAVKEVEAENEKVLRERTITWMGEDVDALGVLGPEEEGDLNFQVNLIDAATAKNRLAHPDEVAVALQVGFTVGRTGDIEEETTVSTNPIVLNLNTDLSFDAHARYYADNGEQLGSGPLPPQTGEQTAYRVIWELENSIHDVEELIVSAELPSEVSWTNEYEVSAGEVDFTAQSNTINWKLNRLPADVGDARLGFDVALTPTDSQIGEIAGLTKKITMTAKDAATGGQIIQTILPLTTAVERDDEASDKGLVVE